MMMMDVNLIKVKLIELKFFPGSDTLDSNESSPNVNTQMKLMLKEVKAVILAKGASKFIDLVETIIKLQQYDELGNQMIGTICKMPLYMYCIIQYHTELRILKILYF